MNARERFNANKDFVKGYTDLLDSAPMQAALDAAMLQFHDSLAYPSDMATSAANEWRRQGAKQFRVILETLALSQTTPQPKRTGNLNHNA